MNKHNPKPKTHNSQPTTHNPELTTHNREPITHNPEQTTLDELNPELTTQNSPPVECLGMTFENDEKRRQYFLEQLKAGLNELREKLDTVFSSFEDTLQRLSSFLHWPMGSEQQIRNLAQRITQAAKSDLSSPDEKLTLWLSVFLWLCDRDSSVSSGYSWQARGSCLPGHPLLRRRGCAVLAM